MTSGNGYSRSIQTEIVLTARAERVRRTWSRFPSLATPTVPPRGRERSRTRVAPQLLLYPALPDG
jgi:hypothetical protein